MVLALPIFLHFGGIWSFRSEWRNIA